MHTRNRKLLCDGLEACGYELTRPAGAFYLFPRSPVGDDVEFVNVLQEELILVVPGAGFWRARSFPNRILCGRRHHCQCHAGV
ncbi:MAG: hypothetical protein R2875_00840 [Desulfobacterales bacterium]